MGGAPHAPCQVALDMLIFCIQAKTLRRRKAVKLFFRYFKAVQSAAARCSSTTWHGYIRLIALIILSVNNLHTYFFEDSPRLCEEESGKTTLATSKSNQPAVALHPLTALK